MSEKQTKMDSFMEAATNTAIGFVISLITWVITAKYMGIPMTWNQNFTIVSILTMVSILRSYILRRLFNGRSVWATIKGKR